MDSSLSHIDSLSIRSAPPTMEVLMNRASNPASLRCSLSSDRDDIELLFPDKSFIPEYEALGTAMNVSFYKLDLTFDFSDTDTGFDDNKDHVAFSIVSRIDCYMKIKVTRKRIISIFVLYRFKWLQISFLSYVEIWYNSDFCICESSFPIEYCSRSYD